MAGPPLIQVTIKLLPKHHARLFEEAKRHGYALSTYAQLLFEAAFAARMGQLADKPATDAELDQQVRQALILAGIGDRGAIAKATGLAEPVVAKILDGFAAVRREQGGKSAKARGRGA